MIRRGSGDEGPEWRARVSVSAGLGMDVDGAHHAEVFVVEGVAGVDGPSSTTFSASTLPPEKGAWINGGSPTKGGAVAGGVQRLRGRCKLWPIGCANATNDDVATFGDVDDVDRALPHR